MINVPKDSLSYFFFIMIDGQKLTGVEVVVYEPTLKEDNFFHSRVIRDFEAFKKISDVIVANRWEEALEDVKDKVFTRDLFTRD